MSAADDEDVEACAAAEDTLIDEELGIAITGEEDGVSLMPVIAELDINGAVLLLPPLLVVVGDEAGT